MKHLYSFIILLLLFAVNAVARPTITFKGTTGNWSVASSWDLGRIPTDGDSVIIPVSDTATMDKNQNLQNIYVKVSGVLIIAKQLKLTGTSIVELTSGASITAGTNNRNTELIVINGVSKYDSNSPATISGPAIASDATGVAPSGFSVSSVLPVSFTSFYANSSNGNVLLTWSTAQESNNSYFEIEKSADGTNWKAIATVAGAGNTTTTQQYSYTDRSTSQAVAYYRIKQVDVNGSSIFSIIKTIKINSATAIAKIYAAQKLIHIEFNQEIKNPVTIKLVNINGQVIAEQKIQQAAYQVNMTVNGNTSGVYIVNINDGQGLNESKKVIF